MSSRVFVTFDIEDWYHANFKTLKNVATRESDIDNETDIILDICETKGVKATCFILGSVAKERPAIVKKFHRAGHEIASHGFAHKLVYDMTPEEFRQDVKMSVDILENITGEKVEGFRAPSWSVKKETTKWYYNALSELGIKYSSSVYPAGSYLFGIPEAPKKPFKVCGSNGYIVEIPVPVTKILGRHIGYTGGFYLRFFPLWFIKRKIRLNKNDFFIYLHPREIGSSKMKMELGPVENIIAYYGIKGCRNKFGLLMENIGINGNEPLRMKDYASVSSGYLPEAALRAS